MPTSAKAIAFLSLFFGVLIITAFALPAIPQDAHYHDFALDQAVFGIANFWNVFSNVAFIVVAALGCRRRSSPRSMEEIVFLGGVFLTGLGSAYYHYAPSNDTLFWDRLPMTIAFSGVIAALVAGRIHAGIGRRLLWPVCLFSAATVVYWRWTEQNGHGNLAPYGVVQFGTILLVLAVLLIFRRKDAAQKFLWLALGAYVLAKLLEAFDRPASHIFQIMGGHPLKHVAAAVGCWFIWRALFSSAAPQPVSDVKASNSSKAPPR